MGAGGGGRDPNWKIPIRFFCFVFEAFPNWVWVLGLLL
jgi:hypothetical protein